MEEKSLYFIAYTVYAFGDYNKIINKGSTTMNMGQEEIEGTDRIVQAITTFLVVDAQRNNALFNPSGDMVVIDCVSRL